MRYSLLRAAAVAALLAAAPGLAGCAGSAATRSLNALAAACDGYATALDVVTPYKARMSVDQAARIAAANAVVAPVCAPGSGFDPREGVALVERAIDVLNGIKGELR